MFRFNGLKWMISLLTFSIIFLFNNCGDSNASLETKKEETTFAEKSVESIKEQTEGKEGIKSEAVTTDFMSNKGVGPVTQVEIGELNAEMVEAGKKVYNEKCISCHKPDRRFIGPAPKGILERRSPEWVMNMILNPEKMIKEDPIAKQLLVEYNSSPMVNQNLTHDEARSVLEYFRTL